MKEEMLLHQVLAKAAHERASFLASACGGDDALLQQVEALLAAHGNPGSVLQQPASGLGENPDAAVPQPPGEGGPSRFAGAASGPRPSTEGPGSRIGPYNLLQLIGEGGMGAVFLAEQSQPVQRKVALKVIKPGMDSQQVIARFEAERQALALMDHPHIARVLDAGTTDSGQPYFVMELVKGIPITKYCDERRLTPKERLQLFVPVCQAVQHAHQKGIIHRDLKPSNVLIPLYDGVPVPKVIDFGVAKATGPKLTERTLFTEFGALVGTLEYMSPEQAELNQLDIDTRSDIYALGVLLYELLTGSTPLERKRAREAGLLEALRIIREEETPRPSVRLSTVAELAGIAANRGLEPKKLSGLVRGELDWIVMKALEKDRNRRYDTANGLARDLERYLQDEPVQACPPSASYRLRKFVRRNKGPVLAAGLLFLALTAGMAGTTWGLLGAERARHQAVLAQEQAQDNAHHALASAAAEKQAKETAQQKEAETRAVLAFVENRILAAARPQGWDGGLDRDVTLARALEAAVPFVEKSFTDQPLVEARLRMTLGISFSYRGQPQKAAEQFEAARTIYTSKLGTEHLDTLRSMHALAIAYYTLGRYAEALKLEEEALAQRKARLGPDHPDTLASATTLANVYAELGRHAEALPLREETVALMRARLGPDHPSTLMCMNNLANSYNALGRYAQAAQLLEQTLALQKAKVGPDHPSSLITMNNLANNYHALGRYTDALQMREQTLALRKAKLGADHPDTLASMNTLANSYSSVGRHAEALQLHQQTLALRKAKLGADHPDTLTSMNNLAELYDTLGRHADALQLHKETLALRKAKLGAGHPDTLWTLAGLAATLLKLDRGPEAVAIIDDCMHRAAGRDVHPRLLPKVMYLRLRHFEKTRDGAGCQATAQMWEKLARSDATSLYDAACMRAVAAAVIRASDKSPVTARRAATEADEAMAWLRQAVSAGFDNVTLLKENKDLDALRDWTGFQELVVGLEAGKRKELPKKKGD
jgi:serine/threonine protein kinase